MRGPGGRGDVWLPGTWGRRGPRNVGVKGSPGTGGDGPGPGPAALNHLPVAPLEDHREGAVPDQVLARELELAHGLQAAAAGLHGAGRAAGGPGRPGSGGAGRGQRAGGARHRAGRGRSQPGRGSGPTPSRPGSDSVSDTVPTGATTRFGQGFGLRLGPRRGNKRAAAAGPQSPRRPRTRTERRGRWGAMGVGRGLGAGPWPAGRGLRAGPGERPCA